MGAVQTTLWVIDPYVIAHVMENPARGRRFTVRELAQVIGVDRSLLGHLRSGGRRRVKSDVARRIAEAVGCEVAVLFAPQPSTESDNRAVA